MTIPKRVREELGIEPGDEVAFVETEAGYETRKEAPTTEAGGDPFEKYRGAAGEGSVLERMRRLRGEYPRGDEEATDP